MKRECQSLLYSIRAFTSGTLPLVLSLTLAGCAASPPQRLGDWVDPSLGQNSRMLRSGPVLIACDTFDLLMRQPCESDLMQALAQRGASPIVAPGAVAFGARETEAQMASSATALGANAVFILTLAPASTSGGWNASGMSIGLGGFSGGRNSGVGLGLSAPIGGGGWGGGGAVGFSATGRVIDVRTGRLVWSSNFVASPSSDLGGQVRELMRSVLDSAQSAGVL